MGHSRQRVDSSGTGRRSEIAVRLMAFLDDAHLGLGLTAPRPRSRPA